MAQKPFIVCAEQSVPEKEARDLQVWLGKSECSTLVKIIESKVREQMAEVTNAALQAVDGAPLKMNIADEHLAQAARFRDFLIILENIKAQAASFTINKWT